MSKYEIISIDMFQTLVNIDSRIKYIWKRILQSDYTEELQNKFVNHVSTTVVNKFHTELSKNNDFLTLNILFYESFQEIFQNENVDYCPLTATNIFINEHNNAELYNDFLEFLFRASKKFKICLTSDADYNMIRSHLQKMQFDKVFISEQEKSYKGNSNGNMFNSILSHYNVEPKQVLHIGDSSSDILGADRMKIDTCWINRHEYKKHFNIASTYEVKSLKELFQVLDI